MKKRQITNTIIFGIILFLSSCTNEPKQNHSEDAKNMQPIFQKLSPSESGITFSNNLKEDSVINYFTYPYIYMGGGVAIGDFNNDGLQDIYFTGNMVSNKLFLNKGNLNFEDITDISGTGGDSRWATGATTADVNADGWLDIYVSVSGKFATTKNMLFINNGLNNNGIPTFTEGAEKRGIADEGHNTQGVFFDYDKDGDLDLYVANYPPTHFKTPNYSYQIFIEKKAPEKSDKLYQNNGDGYFKDITKEAGLLNFGLSLSATVGDFNQDGWDDIYVSNDFATPDYFYINNGDGTFTDKIKEATKHTAYFGMGADAADFNNDGLLDILQMDMTPADNRRNKANMASMNIPAFWEIVSMGMHYQYMQNTLQLNNGTDQNGLPHFSDISRLAGMSSTDWSWAALFADLDNDGWKDVFITNGTRRDINNKDYFKKIEKASYQVKKSFKKLDLTLNMPSEKVGNYAYKNNGDLSFTSIIKDWGLAHEGFTNGAAYADLDNDGDLDMVINNIDEPAIVFKNKTSDLNAGNYLRFKLTGSDKNLFGIGTKILLKNKNQIQYQELTLSRGFQSSVEP
ncbi:MAG TPA: CRTAC1 family protein, partial [Bacteroidetes bacterium]|nr:CRTAC1 family protein [Bacteroidota bacterium]